jgi:cobalt/nickel transport system permease protein
MGQRMHVEIDRYARIASPIHRWDPRCRLIGLGVLIIVISGTRSWASALAGLLVAFAGVLLARMPLFEILHRIQIPAVLIFLLVLLLPFTFPGKDVDLHFTRISSEGIMTGCLIFIRAVALMLLVFPWIGASPVSVTLQAMRRLRIPSFLVQVAGGCYRYIFLFLDEARLTRLGMSARGYEPHRRGRRLRMAAREAFATLYRSVLRINHVYLAMRARGFMGKDVSIYRFHLRGADVAGIALSVLLGSALLALEFQCPISPFR